MSKEAAHDAHPVEQVVRGLAAIDLPGGTWDHVKMGSDDFTIEAYGIYDDRIVLLGVLKDKKRTIELSYPAPNIPLPAFSDIAMKRMKGALRVKLDTDPSGDTRIDSSYLQQTP